MVERKELGKIESVRLGSGGYQDAMFGVTFGLSFGGSACMDFKGGWTTYPKGRAEYTEEQWRETHAATMLFLLDLMRRAKVDRFDKLAGTPIEVTFDGMTLKEWRVLEEVL